MITTPDAKCKTSEDVWGKARRTQAITNPEAAICLRAVLAARFPGVKFSIRSGHGLMVEWKGGPEFEDVFNLASTYVFSGFDGSIDMGYPIYRWLYRDGSTSLAHLHGTAQSMGTIQEFICDPIKPDAVIVKYGPPVAYCNREEQ